MLTTTRIHRICTLTISACLALPAMAAADTVRFTAIGATGWTVPANVSRVNIAVAGASGGHDGAIGSSCTPGRGGEVATALALNPGETLKIFVGERGGDASGSIIGKGGAGGGGAGGGVFFSGAAAAGGGGGGESYVKGPTILSPDVPTAFIAEAGGGGGCGGFASSSGGNGGTSGPVGSHMDGAPGSGGAGGGAAGAGTGAGGANVPADSHHGGAGKPGLGGDGFGSSAFAAGGGGGGGGVVGGGGGGAAAAADGSGGGGGAGASEFTGNATLSYGVGQAPSTGDGWVTITYTPAPAPELQRESASDVTDNTATITADVNPAGIVAQYHVVYGTTTAYGERTSDRSTSGTDVQSVSEPLSQLAPRTLYHYRLVVTNASGTTEGPDQTFQTPGAPSATSGGSSDVSETAATLGGTVNPNGHATSYQFEYGPTTSYGALTLPVSAGDGNSDQSVTTMLTGLAPGTVYHYRLVATNASGTTDGADQIVKTVAPSQNTGNGNAQPAPPSPPAAHPALTVIGHPTVAHGSVRLTVACRFAPCGVTAVLTANVTRHTRGTIASSTARLRAGARTTITVSLNAAGRRLLTTRARIAARLVVALEDGSGRGRGVASIPVALR